MRFKVVLLLVLLVGCAGVSEDPLLWSDPLVRSLSREHGDVVEVARFSGAHLGQIDEPWEPYFIQRGNAPTAYQVVDVDGARALEAIADEGGSAMLRKIRIDPQTHPVVEWRWRVPRPENGAPVSVVSPKSAMARLSIAFHGDPERLDVVDRAHLRLAKALTPNGLPYATLVYVWLRDVPVGSVVVSPYSDRVRLVVAESGERRIGKWIDLRRNVLEDYRRAFGEEPGDIVAVGVMTDPGDDGSRRRAYYGDIMFRSAK